MNHFPTIRSHCVPLLFDNVDTDQIIPARFLKGTRSDDLGAYAFADWRYDSNGMPRADFVMNADSARGAQVLVAGYNFGCGSSREHAAWALRGAGFRAVISTRFADIFRNNALKNGLLPVEIGAEHWRALCSRIASDTRIEVVIDLAEQTLDVPGVLTTGFEIDAFARACLLEGVDELGYLLARQRDMERYESERPA